MTRSTGSDVHWFRQRLVEAARLLAADYNDQVAALPTFDHVPDELLNEFGEAFLLARQALDAGLLTPHQFAIALDLDQACEALPVSEDYHEALAAVRNAQEWEALRVKARELLKALGEEVRLPDLSHAVYVPARRG